MNQTFLDICEKYHIIYMEIIDTCQRPAILSSRSERILSVRDKVKCQGAKKRN